MTRAFLLLSQRDLAVARLAFRQLTIRGPEDGDRFFEAFGVGNTISAPDRPYERFQDYEALLLLLNQDDPEKYAAIHKGVPFFFMAWTAFDLRDFERFAFYLDSAIREDMRKDPTGWQGNPAFRVLGRINTDGLAVNRAAAQMGSTISDELRRFTSETGVALDHEAFLQKFVVASLELPGGPSIVAAVYSFILEIDDRMTEVLLKGSRIGGSISPFITHIFKGCLAFESLLKQYYPDQNHPLVDRRTIGTIFGYPQFQAEFNLDARPMTGTDSLGNILSSILAYDVGTAFRVVGQLRNTTGHDLSRDDVFSAPEDYARLCGQVVNAILYLIEAKSLRGA
jgi:hypothetical protein